MFTYFQRGLPIKCLSHNRKKSRPTIDWNFYLWNGNGDKAEVVWIPGRLCRTLELNALREHALRSWCIAPRSWLLIECCPPALYEAVVNDERTAQTVIELLRCVATLDVDFLQASLVLKGLYQEDGLFLYLEPAVHYSIIHNYHL